MPSRPKKQPNVNPAPTVDKTGIGSRAMLVDLTIHRWRATAGDRRVDQEVAQAHGSDASMGTYRKKLVKDALNGIGTISSRIEREHKRLTLPWRDGGDRILPSPLYFDHAEMLRREIPLFNAEVATIRDNWGGILTDAQARLNGLFDPKNYPSQEKIAGLFRVECEVSPLPTAGDFRCEVSKSDLAAFAAKQNDRFTAGIRDIAKRVQETVGHLAETLAEYTVTDEGVSNAFRDSIVDNIREQLKLLPILNITDDPAVAAVIDRMKRELSWVHADNLRTNKAFRESTLRTAESILKDVGGLIA